MKQLRNRHFFLADLLLLGLAVYLSYLLRLEDFRLVGYRPGFVIFTALALIITPLVFRSAGVYSRYWRYASAEEMLLLIGAVTAAAVLTGGISYVLVRLLPSHPVLPRSIPLIFFLLALSTTASLRLAVRLGVLYGRRYGNVRSIPVLVIGAGDVGALIVRELQVNPQLGMEVVGFLDDDRAKQDMRIHGVPVLGTRHDISRVVEQYKIEQAIIAMPKAPGKLLREIMTRCEQAGAETKIIPAMYELLGGTVSINQLRSVKIEDLLRREPIEIDASAVSDLLRGKRVLITGGGGSIGSELCRQVLRSRPRELMIIGHGENSVFETHNELLHLQETALRTSKGEQPTKIHAVIADIRFADRIRGIFEDYRPEIVFHAAAHKHVPLMEHNPAEAITNNVLGTRNLLDAAQAVGVQRFVMISTDKAVNPTSIMGATKRVAEFLVHQAAERSGRPYVAVRFGNVLGSRGSVVLTFKQQIAAGGPVHVTDPEMCRFFMTIPEAVQLVLQAAVLGKGREVFVLDMGKPVKIVDLARDLIELSGLEVGKDIDIVFTGMRPGEKLFEELFVSGENYRRTRHEKIFIASNASSFVPSQLNEALIDLALAAQRNDKAQIVRTLQQLVAEFRPLEAAAPALAAAAAPVEPAAFVESQGLNMYSLGS
jgi:FlaA1/EpsC-like NDP-sugar epimerase